MNFKEEQANKARLSGLKIAGIQHKEDQQRTTSLHTKTAQIKKPSKKQYYSDNDDDESGGDNEEDDEDNMYMSDDDNDNINMLDAEVQRRSCPPTKKGNEHRPAKKKAIKSSKPSKKPALETTKKSSRPAKKLPHKRSEQEEKETREGEKDGDGEGTDGDGDGDRAGEDPLDEFGDMILLDFLWPKNNRAPKKVRVRWSKNLLEVDEKASTIIMDIPHEALHMIWTQKRDNIDVREWATKAFKKRMGRTWKDIETYAFQNEWEGALAIPIAAGAVEAPIASTVVMAQKIVNDGFGDRHNEGFGDTESPFGIVAPTAVVAPDVVVAGVVLDAVSDIGTEATTTPTTPFEPCQKINHFWEECDKPAYVVFGCLKGKIVSGVV